MTAEQKPDMSCVPYRRKGLYFALTIPFLGLLIVVFIYLWRVGFVLSLVFLLLYLATCYFQSYCCAYQECPYVGGFCPAIAGIMPSSILAKFIYSRKPLVKSKKMFDLSALLAIGCWLAMVGFPLFWIADLGPGFAIGYVVCHIGYYIIFGLTICPACAIRHTCPGGKLQQMVYKKGRNP